MISDYTKIRRNIILLFAIQGLFLFRITAQNVHFKTYSVSEGLCHPFIYNISQDKNGFIWLGTGEGLCRFDGFE